MYKCKSVNILTLSVSLAICHTSISSVYPYTPPVYAYWRWGTIKEYDLGKYVHYLKLSGYVSLQMKHVHATVPAPIMKAFSLSYLYGSGDEGNLCSWVQVLVDDEPAGPLACTLHPAALDQHQQHWRVGQGVWGQVNKTGGFIWWGINLNVKQKIIWSIKFNLSGSREKWKHVKKTNNF